MTTPEEDKSHHHYHLFHWIIDSFCHSNKKKDEYYFFLLLILFLTNQNGYFKTQYHGDTLNMQWIEKERDFANWCSYSWTVVFLVVCKLFAYFLSPLFESFFIITTLYHLYYLNNIKSSQLTVTMINCFSSLPFTLNWLNCKQ